MDEDFERLCALGNPNFWEGLGIVVAATVAALAVLVAIAVMVGRRTRGYG